MSIRKYESLPHRALHALGLVLMTADQQTDVDSGLAILSGTGAPSGATYGGQTLATGQAAIAIREDAPDIDHMLYLTLNGGTAWSAVPVGTAALYTGTVSAPAADDASGVHASNGDNVQTWPGPITNPGEPRNITITFGASWAGGNVTVTGTDIDDAALVEVITASAGSRVAGAKAFKTVTAIAHASAGPGGAGHGATAGWGHVFGIGQTPTVALGILSVDGATESATWNTTNRTFNPTNLPNGSRNYAWAVPT